LSVDIIVKFLQQRPGPKDAIQYRGVTLVASADGTIRYVIHNKPGPPIKKSTRAVAALRGTKNEPPAQTGSPFGKRFRLTRSEHRRLFPELSLTESEIQLIREHVDGS
jgi:hypothetical protein